MEKFGVDEQAAEQDTKTAGQGCPKCGGTVERQGALKFCKRCGSEPFEQAPKKK